jgi:hypothetical protein
VSADPNPYQPPQVAIAEEASQLKPRSNVSFSIFMIVAGTFFFVTSLYIVFGHGITAAITSYKRDGPFSFAYMVFYGITGGFTAMFHASYLIRKWPTQVMAGMYAIAIGVTITVAVVLIIKLIV